MCSVQVCNACVHVLCTAQCAVVCSGVQWCAVMCSGVKWCSVVCSCVQWCVVVCSGVQWCAVVGYVSSLAAPYPSPLDIMGPDEKLIIGPIRYTSIHTWEKALTVYNQENLKS